MLIDRFVIETSAETFSLFSDEFWKFFLTLYFISDTQLNSKKADSLIRYNASAFPF